jgi:hypothetical protein
MFRIIIINVSNCLSSPTPGIISSDRSLARSTRHGLTELGREQGLLSAKNLVDLLEKQPLGNVDGHDGKKKRMFIYSSPFAR